MIALLCSVSDATEVSPLQAESGHRLVRACLSLIEQHLADKLSVAQLASELYVSASTLSHLFKKEMGISLYRYVTQKRLVCACAQIERGIPPTAVFAACGYTDYSSFYRAYLKMFGHSPRVPK